MVSAELIRDVALVHFADKGYEGASLQDIATDVGIKKPSIYAHFKGKDDLFLHVANYVFQQEKRKMITLFASRKDHSLEENLVYFFDWIVEENKHNEHAKFLLRVSYFPPTKLYNELMRIVNPFFADMERLLAKYMRKHSSEENEQKKYLKEALAYITIVDGAVIELIFNGEDSYYRRVRAIWPIYFKGVQR